MGKIFDGIDDNLAGWLQAQPVYFVATAPLSADGHVNVSPKGSLGTFRVLDEHTVAYLDLTGSGIETVAHLRENGRITLMFCAFDGRPRVVRLWGTGRVTLPGDEGFAADLAQFPAHPGSRSIIRVEMTRVADSCGYAVPRMTLESERDVLDLAHVKRGAPGLAAYRDERNAVSIDGLPGWPTGQPVVGG